jgi:hypothetical protein
LTFFSWNVLGTWNGLQRRNVEVPSEDPLLNGHFGMLYHGVIDWHADYAQMGVEGTRARGGNIA